MENGDKELNKSISTWIVSLAISVVFCALWFVIFAQFVVDMKHSLTSADERLQVMAVREDQLLAEIRIMHKMIANAPMAPTGAAAAPLPPLAAPMPAAPVPDVPANLPTLPVTGGANVVPSVGGDAIVSPVPPSPIGTSAPAEVILHEAPKMPSVSVPSLPVKP